MSKICEMCGKKPIFGNNVSHAHNKTRRRWNPNLQKVRINDHGRIHTVSICTSCLRKGGFQKVV